MEKEKCMPQKRLILTILLQEEAKKYKLTDEQANNLLRILESHYQKGNKIAKFEDIKDELIKLILSSKITSVTHDGDRIEISLEPSEKD